MTMRTITLTDRPPVKIDEDTWPVIARAKDSEHDGQVECQANRRTVWAMHVRQHKDGRTIVYATYSYDSQYQHERGYEARHGVMLAAPAKDADDAARIVSAIQEVGRLMAAAECDGEDAARWPTLVAETIADLPPEVLS